MLQPKKKLSKREIKEDKFVQAAMSARVYVEENYRKVLTITGAIFAVIILLMIWRYVHKMNVEQSSALLGKAQLEYQNLNYPKAKEFLFRLLEEYPGSSAAKQGKFLLANLYFQENNIEEAKRNFREFIDSYSGSNFLMASGLAGYAACLEKENEYREAAEYYEQAQKRAPEFVEAPNYLFLAGLNYKEAGMNDKARAMFEKIERDYPSSQRKEDARAELIILARNF